MIYAVDFDGTIVENKWPEIGDLKSEAVNFIKTAKAAKHTIILNTMRTGKRLKDAVEFLKKHDLEPDFVNENMPSMIKKFGGDSRKIFADVYIDDRNAGGLVWPKIKIDKVRDEK